MRTAQYSVQTKQRKKPRELTDDIPLHRQLRYCNLGEGDTILSPYASVKLNVAIFLAITPLLNCSFLNGSIYQPYQTTETCHLAYTAS